MLVGHAAWMSNHGDKIEFLVGVYRLHASVVFWPDWTRINLERSGERRRRPHDFPVIELSVRLHVDKHTVIQPLMDRPFEMQISIYLI